MTSDQPAPVRAELALRHRDMDALGHVNQAVYHELLEEVRAAFLRYTLPDLPSTGYVLVHVELDYRREVRIEDRYVIGECRARPLTRRAREPAAAGRRHGGRRGPGRARGLGRRDPAVTGAHRE